MKVVETGVDGSNRSKIIRIDEPRGDEIPGHRIANLFYQNRPDLGKPQDPPPKGFDLAFGALRFIQSVIYPTYETVSQIVDNELIPLNDFLQHSTQTIDFVVVQSGVITLLVGPNERVVLYPGDVVIQRGARHTWHNYTNQPASILVAMIGADAPKNFEASEAYFPPFKDS
jgi:quercetin dioxygenase-like cupin family protein